MDNKLKLRVIREKKSHEDNSILEKSINLKNIFCHVLTSPTLKRLNRDEKDIYSKCKGMQVLDVGSGFGERSIQIAKCGGQVIGIDISQKYIMESKKIAH